MGLRLDLLHRTQSLSRAANNCDHQPPPTEAALRISESLAMSLSAVSESNSGAGRDVPRVGFVPHTMQAIPSELTYLSLL
jgi:hypothetical protein